MCANSDQDVVAEKRYEILLDIIDSLSSTFEHPTSALLHEYILLCRLRSSDIRELRDYNFSAYIRGPFSEQLRNDIEILGQRGLIQFNESRLTLSSKGKELMQEIRKKRDPQTTKDTCAKVLADFKTPHAISQGIYPYLKNTQLGEALSLP